MPSDDFLYIRGNNKSFYFYTENILYYYVIDAENEEA